MQMKTVAGGGVAERPCVRLQNKIVQFRQRIYKGSNPFPTFIVLMIYSGYKKILKL